MYLVEDDIVKLEVKQIQENVQMQRFAIQASITKTS